MDHGNALSGEITIRVVGVGGGGCNAIDRMIAARMRCVGFIAVNTDSQVLLHSQAAVKVRIGDTLTKGLGAGGDPNIGQRAAEESYEELRDVLQGADMAFIVAGMGGGTGTGAAPVIARIARELGALTIGVITKPFSYEGTRRRRTAERGSATLKENVDTLITVPNDQLAARSDQKMTIQMAFALANDVLQQAIQGISDTITVPGLVNLDFADVKSVLAQTGPALIGIGRAAGDTRAMDAAKLAVASTLLDASLKNARGVLCSITGNGYTMLEVNDAVQVIRQAVDPGAHIIFGATFDAALADTLQVTLIATGFSDHPDEPEMPGRRSDEPPWSGGPPPSTQRIPRRPSPGTRSAAAEAAQPDIDLPSAGRIACSPRLPYTTLYKQVRPTACDGEHTGAVPPRLTPPAITPRP